MVHIFGDKMDTEEVMKRDAETKNCHVSYTDVFKCSFAEYSSRMTNTKYCQRINRRLLPVKTHNILFLTALGCAFPFRTVFAKQLGISATAVGIIFCVIPFIKVVTNPLFGFIFDYFKKIRVTLFVILILVALSHIAMVFIPPKTAVSQNILNITDREFFSKVKYSPVNSRFSFDYDPSLLIYSEFREEKNFERNFDRNFTCNLLCSDNSNDFPSRSFDVKRQCSKNINIEILVHIGISDCTMNVNLKSGKLFIREDNNFSLFKSVNENSAIHVKSWVFPKSNCSGEVSTSSDSSLLTNHESAEMKTKEQEGFGAENATSTISDERFEFTTIPESSFYDRNFRYYSTLHKYDFRIQNNNTNLLTSDCRIEFTCQTKNCYSEVVNGDSTDLGSEFLTVQFWALLFLLAFVSILCSAILFLMDAICYEILQEDRDNYGRQRLWGTVGWGIGGLAGGYLNQVAGGDSGEVDYTPAFYLLAVFLIIDLIPIYKLELTNLKYSSNIWKDVCFILSKMSIVYNVFMVCAIGVLSGFMWNYQFWFMEEIGSSQVLLGLSQIVECAFEIPCFIVSGYIIKKIGHAHCNNVTLLCLGLRYLCFFFMYNPWWTLAAAIFYGPTFGLFYASMTMFAKNESPPGTEATVQSLLHLFFEGIGVAAGSVLGGVGIDKLGSRTSFLCAATISFMLLFLNFFISVIFSRVKKKSPEEKNNSSNGTEIKHL